MSKGDIMDFFKKSKARKADRREQVRKAMYRAEMSERKGIWTPSAEDRRRLVVQDILLQGMVTSTDGETFSITASMYTTAILRHTVVPEDIKENPASVKLAESDAALLSSLTSKYLTKHHMGGDS